MPKISFFSFNSSVIHRIPVHLPAQLTSWSPVSQRSHFGGWLVKWMTASRSVPVSVAICHSLWIILPKFPLCISTIWNFPVNQIKSYNIGRNFKSHETPTKYWLFVEFFYISLFTHNRSWKKAHKTFLFFLIKERVMQCCWTETNNHCFNFF